MRYKKIDGSGRVYDTLDEATEYYCVETRCQDCEVRSQARAIGKTCATFLEEEQEKAVELMRLIAIPDVAGAKPSLGVAPYWAVAQDRIDELAQAISRYSRERDGYKEIRGWAAEIVEQCDLLHYMDIEYEEDEA